MIDAQKQVRHALKLCYSLKGNVELLLWAYENMPHEPWGATSSEVTNLLQAAEGLSQVTGEIECMLRDARFDIILDEQKRDKPEGDTGAS